MDLLQKNPLRIRYADPGNAEGQTQGTGNTEVAAVEGKAAGPVLFEFAVEMLHVDLIFFLIDVALDFGREGVVVLVGDSVDELDAGGGHDDHLPDSLEIMFFAFQTHIIRNDYPFLNIILF